MRYYIFLPLLLVACTKAEVNQFGQDAKQFGQEVKEGAFEKGLRVKEFFTYRPEPERPYIPNLPQRYCYSAVSDIVCYANPQEGNMGKLSGYQGPEPLPRYLEHDSLPIQEAEAAPLMSVSEQGVVSSGFSSATTVSAQPTQEHATVSGEPPLPSMNEEEAPPPPQILMPRY